jgi:hypothetical protein
MISPWWTVAVVFQPQQLRDPCLGKGKEGREKMCSRARVCVYMYVHVHECMCVCVCMCTCTCICVNVGMCVHAYVTCVHIHACVHVCLGVRICICVHACTCTRACMCMHACTCVYVCTQRACSHPVCTSPSWPLERHGGLVASLRRGMVTLPNET